MAIAVGCGLLFVGLLWAVHYYRAAAAAKAAASARSMIPEVPVIEGRVQQKDVPIYLDGLGTVQAYNMVTIHVRVDGELKKVAFVEGQDVHAGDLLAQIDPDPFQAGAGTGRSKETSGRSATGQRATGFEAGRRSLSTKNRHPAGVRHAKGPRRPACGDGPGRPGRDR